MNTKVHRTAREIQADIESKIGTAGDDEIAKLTAELVAEFSRANVEKRQAIEAKEGKLNQISQLLSDLYSNESTALKPEELKSLLALIPKQALSEVIEMRTPVPTKGKNKGKESKEGEDQVSEVIARIPAKFTSRAGNEEGVLEYRKDMDLRTAGRNLVNVVIEAGYLNFLKHLTDFGKQEIIKYTHNTQGRKVNQPFSVLENEIRSIFKLQPFYHEKDATPPQTFEEFMKVAKEQQAKRDDEAIPAEQADTAKTTNDVKADDKAEGKNVHKNDKKPTAKTEKDAA
jgi:hypothetical protein